MAFSVTPLTDCSSTPPPPLIIPTGTGGAGGASVTVTAESNAIDYTKWFQALLIGIILLGVVNVTKKKD